jgi:hypothetical protein
MIKYLLTKSKVLDEEETARTYYLNGNVSVQDANCALNYFKNIVSFCESAKFETSGYETIDLHKANIPTLTSKLATINFKLEIEKNLSQKFPIFNFSAYKSSFLGAFRDIETLFGYLNATLKNPILVDSQIQPLTAYLDEDNRVKVEFITRSISQIKKAEITIVPSQVVLSIPEGVDEVISSFFKSILSFYSLLFLCSYIRKERPSDIHVMIDGYREINFSFSTNDVSERFSGATGYHDIACWVFSDMPGKPAHLLRQIYSERIGIARNILSLEISPETPDSVFEPPDSIFRKCRSHFSVYLKSKTKEYFDIRMKLDEHVDKLSKSLSDEVNLFIAAFRANMYGFISIIFTSLLVQATKSDPQKSFLTGNNSVAFLIAMYGVLNILLLLITSGKLYDSIESIKSERKHLIQRFGKLLDHQDVQESVDAVINRRLSRSRIQFSLIAICWVLLSAMLIFNRQLYRMF